jgi:hypothetical protein
VVIKHVASFRNADFLKEKQMKKFPLLLVTASLASVASLAAAQTNALPGQDDMMPPQNQMTQTPQPGPQTIPPQPGQMSGQMNESGPVADAPVQTQRYYRSAQVGPGTPDTTTVPGRSTADSYGASMYGSSQSGVPAATPLIGAPKN